MAQGFRLPAYDVPNKLLDLSPLTSALDGYQQQMNTNAMFGMQQKRDQRDQRRSDREDEEARVARIGREAAAIHQMQGPQRASAWQSWTRSNPDAAALMPKYGIDPNDHTKGPELIAMQAGQWDPQANRAKEAQIAQADASAGLARAQTANVGQTDQIREFRFARQNGFTGSFDDWKKKEAQAGTKTSLVPIYGTDATGNPVVMQPSSSGEMVQSRMPEGVTVSRQPIKLDAGTEYVLLDPITRQPVGRVPKNVADAAAQKEIGEARGKSSAALPVTVATAERALKTIEDIKSHPGKSSGVGLVGAVPPIPGTAQAGFVDLVEQAKGQAFLQAFESLRGGGAITEVEGKKATEAIARLNRARRPEDFDQALRDLESVIRDGVAVARYKAGQQGNAAPAGQGAQSGALPPGSYRFDPSTGQLVPAGQAAPQTDRSRARATVQGIER